MQVFWVQTFLTQRLPSPNFFKLSVPGDLRIFRAFAILFSFRRYDAGKKPPLITLNIYLSFVEILLYSYQALLDILLPVCWNKNKIGLRCPQWPGRCLEFDLWCQREFPLDCGYGVSTNDPRICGNTTFWKDKPCPAKHFRCNGKYPAQCVPSFGQNCEDGSDRHIRSYTKCEAQGGFKCRLVVKLWTEDWTSHSYQIWSENPSNDIFYRNFPHIYCPDPTLICDLYPQCEDGEDELREECEEEYLRKNIFTLEQTFKCSYPYHEFRVAGNETKKLFTHRAIRCNGKPECWSGEDEEGCSTIDDISQYTIRKLLIN